jgi:hypothetical protein
LISCLVQSIRRSKSWHSVHFTPPELFQIWRPQPAYADCPISAVLCKRSGTHSSFWNALQVPLLAARFVPKFETTKPIPVTIGRGRWKPRPAPWGNVPREVRGNARREHGSRPEHGGQLRMHCYTLWHSNCDRRVMTSRHVDRRFSSKSRHVHFSHRFLTFPF